MYLVYTMFDEDLQPLYVGCTKDIRRRMYSHKLKDSFFYISWIMVKDAFKAAKKEASITKKLKPLHNKMSGGYNAISEASKDGYYKDNLNLKSVYGMCPKFYTEAEVFAHFQKAQVTPERVSEELGGDIGYDYYININKGE